MQKGMMMPGAMKYRSTKALTFNGVDDWMANFNFMGTSTFPIRRYNKASVTTVFKSTKGSTATAQVIEGRWFPFNGFLIDEGGWRIYLYDLQASGNPLVNRACVFQVCTHALEGLWIYSTESFPLNEHVRVTLTYDGSGTVAGLKMYWGEVQKSTYTVWGTWTTNALNSNAYSHLLWGCQYTAFPNGVGPVWPPVLTYWFEGIMDESCFWRYELNAQEVAALANGRNPADPLHVGLANGKPAERYFRMGERTDGAPWIMGNSISWCRYPIGGTLSNGFWNNDGATPSLRITEDVAA